MTNDLNEAGNVKKRYGFIVLSDHRVPISAIREAIDSTRSRERFMRWA